MATCKLTKGEVTELVHLIEAYETTCANLSQFLSQVREKWETEIADKSEKWQEGEAGQEAQERLDTLGSWIDELPEELTPNYGDELS